MQGISTTFFTAKDVVRHPLVQEIIRAAGILDALDAHAVLDERRAGAQESS